MSRPGDPWADPSTPTEPGPPYQGPPPTAYPGPYGWSAPPQQWPAQAWPPGYGWGAPGAGGWGYGPPWGPLPPAGPRRPGQVVAAAVLAFVQAALVLFSSAYVFLLASVAGMAAQQSLRLPGQVGRLATEAKVVAAIQLLSVVWLVVAGLMALNRRSRNSWLVLLGALGLQVVLALYWAIRLGLLIADLPGTSNTTGPLLTVSLFFAAPPLVGLGLLVIGPGRQWFTGADHPPV